ncbi:hypothetical protein JD79_00354 [Geodermatophilus normandii]|uniref:Uncharacterized protein n=1 Tax=Geodermatophilus normandii TaxID=1137989 RepID=A0A317QF50_9ACTN|nr:hypothetical protein [Geodermatophilus normandii]PWW21226.1 hypothetical protein JD79_00354 [Geodermatophilus normandii]
MRTSIRCAVVTVGVLAVAGTTGPAAAASKPGDCPPAFVMVDLQELTDVLADADPGLSPEEAAGNAAGAFAAVNRNGDAFLCTRPIGRQYYVNVIDNSVQRR